MTKNTSYDKAPTGTVSASAKSCRVYQRGVLKGRLKKAVFEKAIEDFKVDKKSSLMGGVFFVGKLKEVISGAMLHTDTQALTREMFEKSVELFLKKIILDLEELFRKEEDND